MPETITFIGTGLLLGFAAVLAPGPMTALIISETLKHGRSAGFKVSIAPLLTDVPIVAFVLLILAKVSKFDIIIGIISLIGAGYLTYLGIENLRAKPNRYKIAEQKEKSLRKGIITNFTSPHPYLTWLTIMGPLFLRSLDVGVVTGVLLLVSFYFAITSTNFGIALITDKSKEFIVGKYYLYILRGLGIALIILAITFAKQGIELLSIV